MDFTEIVMQSFIASYVILLVIGIIEITSAPIHIVWLGLIEVVPLAFGAVIANRLFTAKDTAETGKEGVFPQNIAVFTIGALFVASTIART